MKKLRNLLIVLLLIFSLTFLFACNGDEPSGDNGGDNGGENNGENGAPDAPSSLNQYGDNVVDYDSLIGGAAE